MGGEIAAEVAVEFPWRPAQHTDELTVEPQLDLPHVSRHGELDRRHAGDQAEEDRDESDHGDLVVHRKQEAFRR